MIVAGTVYQCAAVLLSGIYDLDCIHVCAQSTRVAVVKGRSGLRRARAERSEGEGIGYQVLVLGTNTMYGGEFGWRALRDHVLQFRGDPSDNDKAA